MKEELEMLCYLMNKSSWRYKILDSSFDYEWRTYYSERDA